MIQKPKNDNTDSKFTFLISNLIPFNWFFLRNFLISSLLKSL